MRKEPLTLLQAVMLKRVEPKKKRTLIGKLGLVAMILAFIPILLILSPLMLWGYFKLGEKK